MLQSGKSATILPSIAASSSGHWNQDGSRRWQRATRPSSVKPQPDQDIAAEAFDQRQPFARCTGWLREDIALRQAGEDLLDQRQALLDFADADPDAGIDVAVLQNRNLEPQPVVRRVRPIAPRIESAARGAADIAAGAELAPPATV